MADIKYRCNAYKSCKGRGCTRWFPRKMNLVKNEEWSSRMCAVVKRKVKTEIFKPVRG